MVLKIICVYNGLQGLLKTESMQFIHACEGLFIKKSFTNSKNCIAHQFHQCIWIFFVC